jgi:spoIIIJ-associated protein
VTRDETPRTPPRPLTPDELQNLRSELTEFFSGICQRLAGGEAVNVTTREEGDRFCLECDHPALGELLRNNSRLSEALEHLIRKKPRHLQQELPWRIFVDLADVRKGREQELVKMAQELSAKVHETQKPVVLNYRSPYERKVIHMALDQDDRVFTKSIGSGASRKLMIVPASQQGDDVGDVSEYEESTAEASQ